MITWFAKNSVAANLLMISILVAGLFSLNTSIPLEVFPSFETHVVSVRVSLPGATPAAPSFTSLLMIITTRRP